MNVRSEESLEPALNSIRYLIIAEYGADRIGPAVRAPDFESVPGSNTKQPKPTKPKIILCKSQSGLGLNCSPSAGVFGQFSDRALNTNYYEFLTIRCNFNVRFVT